MRLRMLRLALPAALGSMAALLPGAHATFPGGNGDIVFSSTRDGNPEIYTMSPGGSNQTRLTNDPAVDTRPAGSPDGQKIVFQSNRDGNYEIYVMNLDGSNQTRLTNSPATDQQPVFSPDGQRIAFHTNRDGNFEIYTMNVDGTGLVRVTDHSASDLEPTWSPSGSAIAFSSQRDGNAEIYQAAPDGTGLLRLTNDPATDFAPDYSPDGTSFMFSSNRTGNFEVFVSELPEQGSTFARRYAQTSAPRNVSNRPQPDSEGKFSPDGNFVTFEGQSALGPDFQIFIAPIGQTPVQVTDSYYNSVPYWLFTSPPVVTCIYDRNTERFIVRGTAAFETIEIRLREGSASEMEVVVNGRVICTVFLSDFKELEVIGGAGDDTIVVSQDISKRTFLGGVAGNDTIYGGGGPNSIEGGDGDDTLHGGPRQDTIGGGRGADRINGGPGGDIIDGGEGDDVLYGDGGGDVLNGSGGTDRVQGGPGTDTLKGGAGSGDKCSGGPGRDRLPADGGCEASSN